MRDVVVYLPHLNAILNVTATILLLAGLWLIKRRRELAHKRAMLGCFAVSILFLGSYLTYHGSLRALGLPEKRFPTSVATPIRTAYFIMLISHVILAATVPVFASVTIYWGLRDRRDRHLKWARWTYPIWLYVSVTGVLIYVALYHVFAVG